MTEETNTEVAEALAAVGEKTGGEVATEAAEAAEAAAIDAAPESPAVESEPAPESAEPAAEPVAEAESNPESSAVAAEGELAPEQLEEFGVEEKAADTESERHRLRAMIEAAIYVSEEPLTIQQLCQGLSQTKDVVESLLAELMQEYAGPVHGVTIREVAGGYKMSTKPEFHEDIRTFVKKLKPPLKLSLAALETLAVIAYKQPVTSPEILEIRGVQGGGVLKTLLERKLITAAGRKQVVGKPVLYKTTKEFLLQFGLKDLAELPTLKEFEEWSRLAIGDDTPEPAPAQPPPAADAAEQTAPESPSPESAAESSKEE